MNHLIALNKMNINLWGPALWSVLHGIVGFTNSENSKYMQGILENLKYLLPCIHCLRSYNEFYPLLQNSELKLRHGEGIELVYKLHNMVNDKLENQKLNSFIAKVHPDPETEARMRAERITLSPRPSLEVVRKRFALSEGRPFSEDQVWRVLIAFVFDIESGSTRPAELNKFVTNLYHMLESTQMYEKLAKELKKLKFPSKFTVFEGFSILAFVKEDVSYKDLTSAIKSEKAWLLPLYELYEQDLPAGSCSVFTCK